MTNEVRRKIQSHTKHAKSGNDKIGLRNHPDRVEFGALNADMLEPPKWLNKEQAAYFINMRDKILDLDIAAVSDVFSLQLFLLQYVQFMDVQADIFNTGLLIEEVDKNGNPIQKANPLLAERGRLVSSIKSMMTEFGLTPNARRKVLKRAPKAATDPEEEEWDDFFGGNQHVKENTDKRWN